MGTALTYARRYALFTLVGIAGEDDLDAPDVATCASAGGHQTDPRQDRFPARGSRNGPRMDTIKNATGVLDPGQSAALRDKLLTEVANLTSVEFAVTWATGVLGACSRLLHRGGIATGSTCAMSRSSHVSSAAVSRRMPIIFGTCSRGRSAARPATNLRSLCAAHITARFIARATSKHGGALQASTPSRSPGSSGNTRA
jgi:hypothetical protein